MHYAAARAQASNMPPEHNLSKCCPLMDTLWWGEAHGANCTYLKIPFFYSKGYVSLDTAKSLQTAPMIVTSGITNRQ